MTNITSAEECSEIWEKFAPLNFQKRNETDADFAAIEFCRRGHVICSDVLFCSYYYNFIIHIFDGDLFNATFFFLFFYKLSILERAGHAKYSVSLECNKTLTFNYLIFTVWYSTPTQLKNIYFVLLNYCFISLRSFASQNNIKIARAKNYHSSILEACFQSTAECCEICF